MHFLSYIFSIPLFCYVKLFSNSSKYIKQISKFSYYHIHSIVFDQLIPEISNYWKKEEVVNLVSNNNLLDIKIYKPPNNMGWIATGIKKGV